LTTIIVAFLAIAASSRFLSTVFTSPLLLASSSSSCLLTAPLAAALPSLLLALVAHGLLMRWQD
jgi:hypothetical protein